MGKNVPGERTPPSMLPASFPSRAATFVAGDVGLMFFLLRMAFWLGLVLILLPSGSSSEPRRRIGSTRPQAISAASATVGDLRQFCTRQPDACTVGSHVATELGYKAQAGAKMLYDFLTDSSRPKETGSVASQRLPFRQSRRLGKPATADQAAVGPRLAEHAHPGRSRSGMARPRRRARTPSTRLSLPAPIRSAARIACRGRRQHVDLSRLSALYRGTSSESDLGHRRDG